MSRELKEKIVHKLKHELQERVDLHKNKMEQIQNSIKKNEPKAGYDEDNSKGELLNDYERHAKLREEHENQLMKLRNDTQPEEFVKVAPGALVRTDNGDFMITAGLGELRMDNVNRFYAISEKSPIYQVMDGKQYDDSFEHENQKYKIEGVY